jgi:effector-binding domain-containing protein
MIEYIIDIVDAAPSPLAVARGSATSWEEFRSAWKPMLDGVWAFLRQDDLRADGHNVMVYRNDPPRLDFEVGVQVTRSFEPVGAVIPSALPAGRAAHAVHRGDYADLGGAHDSVLRWCRAHDEVTTGVRWEVYGDWDDDPSKVQTDVYWLLQS